MRQFGFFLKEKKKGILLEIQSLRPIKYDISYYYALPYLITLHAYDLIHTFQDFQTIQ